VPADLDIGEQAREGRKDTAALEQLGAAHVVLPVRSCLNPDGHEAMMRAAQDRFKVPREDR
jgi:hypothetical protein